MYIDPLQDSSKPFSILGVKTSRREMKDIGKSLLALSFAFALVYSNTNLLGGRSFSIIFSGYFALVLVVSLFTAGLGFVLHELAHKFVAQRYGCAAEFRAFDQMLYMAVGLAAVTGFIFAAPGAVMISGNVTRRENGWISLAGPLTNYVLAIIFVVLAETTAIYMQGVNIWRIGFAINIWLGLFNMIPFGNFDGKKIWMWNPAIWIAMVASGIGLMKYFF